MLEKSIGEEGERFSRMSKKKRDLVARAAKANAGDKKGDYSSSEDEGSAASGESKPKKQRRMVAGLQGCVAVSVLMSRDLYKQRFPSRLHGNI